MQFRVTEAWLWSATAAALLWLVVQALVPGTLTWFGWLPGGVALAVGAGAAWRTAKSAGLAPAGARFWRHIAVATALVTPGACLLNGINTHLVRAAVPLIVAAVVPIGIGLLVMIWAALRLPAARRGQSETLRLGLDAATVMAVAATVLWEFQIRPMIGSDPQLRTILVPLVLCVICLVAVLAVVKLVIAGTDAVARPSLQALGLLVLVGALSSAVTRLLEGDARWLGVGPLISTVEGVLVGWAALQPQAATGALRETSGRRFNLLPYAAVAAIDALLLTTATTGRYSIPVVVASVVVTTLVVGRQVLAFRDKPRLIATLHEHRSLLQHQATHDPLTGLANRSLYYERVSAACATVSAERPPSVLLIDLDGFKGVNDRLGHAAGDALLIEVGRRLERAVGEAGTVARLGGDEFAVLLPSAAGTEATDLAEQIVEGAETQIWLATVLERR
ncbi:diguanylate cyclase domain-containing protein [Actinoplanes sp. URMC 104]|uniref:diguanylate cyclase domain-containing protein n=1 Tax=Actinoplanes sp. URMC 104 TaxID=3423409 RepID=UPI003F1AD0DF